MVAIKPERRFIFPADYFQIHILHQWIKFPKPTHNIKIGKNNYFAFIPPYELTQFLKLPKANAFTQ